MFEGVANTVAVVVLLLEFGMLRAALLRAQIRLYALQSLAVAVLAVVVAAGRGLPELYVLAGLSVALKVIIVPLVMLQLLRETGTRDRRQRRAGGGQRGDRCRSWWPGSAFFAVGALGLQSEVLPTTALSLSVAVVLVVVRADDRAPGRGQSRRSASSPWRTGCRWPAWWWPPGCR